MTESAGEHAGARPAAATPPKLAARQRVVLVGNPNVGKSTLFNALTGQRARVGNYPGVTVELREGQARLGPELEVEVVDVPGSYSLSARSAEEQIALDCVLGLASQPAPELVVLVVDAGQLIRNLYLALQLVELRVPLVIALNMIDEVTDAPPSPSAISQLFGVPCVSTNARKREGLVPLREAMASALGVTPSGALALRYPKALIEDADRVAEGLPDSWRRNVERDRALGLWALGSLEPDDELEHIPQGLRDRCLRAHEQAGDRDLDREIIATRYAFLDAHAAELYEGAQPAGEKRASSERVDRVLLHPVFGFVIFLAVMLVLFQTLFSWADPLISLVEATFGGLSRMVEGALPDGLLRDFLVEGLIGGVGNVVVFLPQILLLFLFIGLLEDTGYMARVAYLMDRIMRSLGLHGRAFVPMLSGFACAVPAILATRTMERWRDRLLTMLVIPLMTCSARLPVYTLIIAALFPPATVLGVLPVQGLLMVAMYLFSVLVALVSAAVIGRTVVKGRQVPLILELPPYRLPNPLAVVRMMWERSWLFLREAGTVILAATVVLWVLLSFPKLPESGPASAPTATAEHAEEDGAARRARQLEHSYAGRVGHAIEPALEPLGFDWKIGVGIIGAFAAREVFISTMGLVYGIGEVDDDDPQSLRDKIRSEKRDDGTPAYTPLAGLSLMIFFALACQCMSTLAVVKRETRGYRWPAFLFAYMTGIAYLASLLVFQLGRAMGF